ncbi:MAG: HDOD domain-containing protein [gamma proteobacterium symbiont of Bathyaustriella thionipta]|nr:HDOD domain-containing protein [gamma proteobacterium symbiont of Bathyaustriella thionipta]MCU7948832.1 HDOD domain-containing protein [gamma proteobacterium symbiont of Bathyaustriella thionipta]MCU7954357.1 HDOD domain-containing protein [gamma proteobacterium symbiont of Bathyaustriella thionipta]MCU7955290.1 HDOD domain-containing protein [gamma proteobacterium symbiont of Bathyaustriella thionipta]MCU7967119.1 HDOD domain-containing protein [gamma proteobacterium symbiont of Bathyaustr
MPSLSTTVTKVLEVCNRPDVSANDLNKIISLDPVLAGNVLKLINSAYYALPNHITSLTRAIIILGINTVKNLALSTAVLRHMKNSEQSSLSMDKFWTHSICVGVTAKAIAAAHKIPVNQQEEFFLAGLLHDLGKIPLAHCFPEEYVNCLTYANKYQTSLHDAETATFGFDHQHCGDIIARKWKLNDNIVSAIKHHHEPEKSDADHRLLISSVAIADVYANIFEIGSAGNHFIAEEHVLAIFQQSALSWKSLTKLHENIQESIEKASIFLHVS